MFTTDHTFDLTLDCHLTFVRAGHVNVDQQRLQAFLHSSASSTAASQQSGSPRSRLEALGCDTSNVPAEALTALESTLCAPEVRKPCELLVSTSLHGSLRYVQAACALSLDDFICGGKLTPGFSTIVRVHGEQFHCFVYSTEAIVGWIDASHSDPITRDNLTTSSLIKLS